MAAARFPVPQAQVVGEVQNKPLMWLGWDFLRSEDLLKVNEEIDSIFLQRALDTMAKASVA